MKKTFLVFVLLCIITAVYSQSIEFVRNGEVVVDGTTVTVTELKTVMREMSPAVLVRNNSNESIAAVLKITVVESKGIGFCGYCGFGTELCVTVDPGNSLARGMYVGVTEDVDPAIHWQGIRGESPVVDATIKYELKTGCTLEKTQMGYNVVEEGTTISTVTVKFIYGDVPGLQNQSINWDQSIPTMTVGDKFKLNAASTSGLPVTYTSSDPLKVEITKDGMLHALASTGERFVTITASQAGNNYYKPATPMQVNVTVKKARADIRLSECVQTYDGKSKQVTVTTNPEGLPYMMKYYQGTYEVTDTKNADVYYVEVIVNTNAYEAVANTWLIVNKAPQIIVWNQEQTLEKGKELMLTASNPSSSQEIEYYSESPIIADIQIKDGKTYLLGKSEGTVRVMARVKGDNNYGEGVEIKTFNVENPVSMPEVNFTNISCYPTQVTDFLYVEGAINGDKIVLTNMAGNEVLALTIRENLEKINLTNMSSGAYLLKVIRNNESSTYKVMKR